MNLVRLACRSAIAWLVCQPVLPASAHAQSDLLLPRQEIKEVLAAQRSRESQVNSLLEIYGRRLRIEFCFVEKACELTPAQVAALKELSTELMQQAREELSQAIEGQGTNRGAAAAHRRLVLMNGRLVNTAGKTLAEEASASQASMVEDVDAAVRKALPAEVAARLIEQRQLAADRVRQAKAASLTAAMDEVLLLSDGQRKSLCRLIASLWKESWSSVAVEDDVNFAPLPWQNSVQVCAMLRGLGGVFDLPDSALEPLLRPAQRTAWKELREPLSSDLADLQRHFVPAAGRGQQGFPPIRVSAKSGLRGIALQDNRGQLRVIMYRSAEQQDAGALVIPSERAARVELLIDAIGRACRLSPPVRKKLLLAGKLGLHREAVRIAELRRQLQEGLPPERRNRAWDELAQAVTRDDLRAEGEPLLHKAMNSHLSPEQRRLWAESLRRRREFQRQARLQIQVLAVFERSRLTTSQWDALAELLNAQLIDMPQEEDADGGRNEAETTVARTPDEKLKPLFAEAQWDAIRERLAELRNALPPAER